MNKIGIYYAFPGTARYERVGSFTVDADSGVAELAVTDERVRVQLEALTGGVTAIPSDPDVLPGEGERFLEALAIRYASSGYWRIADESAELDGCPASRTQSGE